MPARRLLTPVLALPLALAASVALPTGAVASGTNTVVPKNGRFGGRCPAGNKDLVHCHDVLVLDSTGTSAQLQFQLEKRYCSVVTTEHAGSWKYFPMLTRVNGVYRYTWVYEAEGPTGGVHSVALKFTLTGRFTTPTRFVLTVAGKVLKAADDAKDCAHVSFTEQHVLHYVTY